MKRRKRVLYKITQGALISRARGLKPGAGAACGGPKTCRDGPVCMHDGANQGQGPVSPGVYGQGTVGNYGLVINESFNLLHPTSGLSREVGVGTPQASAGIQVIFPACQGTTPHDWAYHPDNPNRQGLMWHPVGRSPF